jgi:DNA polymerase elongation subunit (family B)
MYQNIFVNKKDHTVYLWDDKKGLVTFKNKPYAYKKSPNGMYRSMYGDKLEKVTRYRYEDTGLFESDVPIETRNLIDLYEDDDEPSTGHCVMNFDIEVSMEGDLPDTEKANNPVTAIAWHDSCTNNYVVLILDKENKITDYSNDEVSVYSYDNERALLSHFLDFYQEISPTILTGWNIDGFDVPYLYRRLARVLGQEEANRLSPIGHAYFHPFKKRIVIAGVSCLDYLVLYKNFTYSVEPTYRLDAIGRKEVGIGKIEYEGNLDDLFSSDIEKFIEYNLNDVKIVVEIDKKMELIELTRSICHVGHVPYEDILFSSRYLEGALLTYLRRHNLVAPNKDPEGRERFNEIKGDESKKFSGAYVAAPTPGKYKWVFDLDLTSLYPSIIMSTNISPETKVGVVDNWSPEDFCDGKQTEVGFRGDTYSAEEFKTFLKENNLAISSNGVMYTKEKVGLIPAILDQWFNQRVEFKNKMKEYGNAGDDAKYVFYKRRQHVQKILLNSLYGVLGLPIFRFYDVDNAEAVTTTGVSVIKFSRKIANHYYNKTLGDTEDHCIYIDTDSVFFSALPIVEKTMPNVDVKNDDEMATAILEVADNVQTFINKSYDVMAKRFFNIEEHRYDIKQEVISKASIWLAKKRYAQWIINNNGVGCDELEVKGLDVVRSSFPTRFRAFMTEILKDILKDTPKEEIDDKIVALKRQVKNESVQDIAKTSAVKNVTKYLKMMDKGAVVGECAKSTPAHVKASIIHNQFIKKFKIQAEPIRNGEKIKWIYLKNNELGLDALAFRGYEDPPELMEFIEKYADKDKLFERELEGKLRDFYDALDWDFASENLATAQKFFAF